MTIAVACNLADGIVMGADSAVTLLGQINTAQGVQQKNILNVYYDAEKLFSVFNNRIGIVTYGTALLGKRTIESYVREFEQKHPIPENAGGEESDHWSIQDIAEELWSFFHNVYIQNVDPVVKRETGKALTDLETRERPMLGFMIGGFGPGEYLSELWDVDIRADTKEEGVTPKRKQGNFGSEWRGEIEGVVRFHKGFSFSHLDAIFAQLINHYGEDPPEEVLESIRQIVGHAEYNIVFDGMPLQEGIDYVKFCLDVMIFQTRFVIGAPTCGGNIRLFVITADGIKNVANRAYTLKGEA